MNVLGTVVFDLGRFGIQIRRLAAPRGRAADHRAGDREHEARAEEDVRRGADPKIVIAVGACAISGGPYIGHPEVHNGADSVVPVDLYIPGCPPHPFTILDGLLSLLDRIGPERMADASPPEPDDEKMKWARARAENALKYFGADMGKTPVAPEK